MCAWVAAIENMLVQECKRVRQRERKRQSVCVAVWTRVKEIETEKEKESEIDRERERVKKKIKQMRGSTLIENLFMVTKCRIIKKTIFSDKCLIHRLE